MVDFEQARQYALGRLERELSPRLVYHSLLHTRDDVVKAVERLAEMEVIRGEDWTILLTAAYYHDLGYVLLEDNQYQGNRHEALSCEIAAQVLPGFGYRFDHIQMIRGIIMATCLPQEPRTRLEEIMADADLDSLGREGFWERSSVLRAEMAAFGTTYTELEWCRIQKDFLEHHVYFTQAAHRLRDAQKARNLAEVLFRLDSLEKQLTS